MVSSNAEHRQLLAVAVDAARQAGEIIRRPLAQLQVREKAQEGLVTEIDLAAQEAIISVLRRSYPGHGMLGEEATEHSMAGTQAEQLWVIDPLDGTTNFVHGIPHYAVSIAFARQGQVEVGVVLDPLRNEEFTAIRSGGAWCNNQPITVSDRPSLDQLVVATGFPYDRGEALPRTLATIQHLFDHRIQGVRRLGSAALDLAWVACGRFDAFFEYRLQPWDFAAGMLLVSEAGGCCAAEHGMEPRLAPGAIVAANRQVFTSFLAICRP